MDWETQYLTNHIMLLKCSLLAAISKWGLIFVFALVTASQGLNNYIHVHIVYLYIFEMGVRLFRYFPSNEFVYKHGRYNTHTLKASLQTTLKKLYGDTKRTHTTNYSYFIHLLNSFTPSYMKRADFSLLSS